MNAAKSNKKGIIALLEEYNVSKVDIIIYSVSIVLFILSVAVFFYFKNDLQNKIAERNIKNRRYDTAMGLKRDSEQIRSDYAKLKEKVSNLRSMFLEQKKLSEFIDYVSIKAKEYRASDSLAVSPTAMSQKEDKWFKMSFDIYNFFFQNGIYKNPPLPDKETMRVRAQFIKQQIRDSMELTLGNLLAFLYCMENSSKFMEVTNVILVGGESNIVRVDMNIYAYLLSDSLGKKLKVICADAGISAEDNKITLKVSYPTVKPVIKERLLEKEMITLGDDLKDIRPIFRIPGPPPAEIPIFPPGLNIAAVAYPVVAFVLDNTTYFGKEGEGPIMRDLRNKKGTIPNYPNLKIKKIRIDKDKKVIILDNNGKEKELIFKELKP